MTKLPSGEYDGTQTVADARPAGSVVGAGRARFDPEERATDPWAGSGRSPECHGSAEIESFKTPDPDATLELHPSEMERRAAAAESAVFDSGSVELSGAEAEAARQFAQAERERLDQEPVTQVVPPSKALHLNHECRHCGRRIAAPRPLRFGRPQQIGYRCVTCENLFCVDHSVRVSGLLDTLLHGGRYSCPLCLPEATKRR